MSTLPPARNDDADMADEAFATANAADLVRNYMTSVKHLQRRNGQTDLFDPEKLERSIRASFASAGMALEHHGESAKKIREQAVAKLQQRFNGHKVPTVGDVREIVVSTLIENNFGPVARSYLEHRLDKRAKEAEDVPVTPREIPAAAALSNAPRRHRLNEERKAITHKFEIGAHEGYLTVGLYDDTRQPGEIFIRMSKEGSVMSGLVDAFATAISIGLQYGVPLRVYVNKFANMRFEPSGSTQNPNIPSAKSIVDYIFRWLAQKFLTPEERQTSGIAGSASAPNASPTAMAAGLDLQTRLTDSFPFDGPLE